MCAQVCLDDSVTLVLQPAHVLASELPPLLNLALLHTTVAAAARAGALRSPLSSGASKALLRLYSGSIKALLRLY